MLYQVIDPMPRSSLHIVCTTAFQHTRPYRINGNRIVSGPCLVRTKFKRESRIRFHTTNSYLLKFLKE
ncbi:unnamed protein product [Trichobilharzia regenti]|nr:unnamed protein product [Trichobilharzia regenti]